MNTIERVRALFPVGATVLCVENTYLPKHNGTTRRIVAAGVAWRDCHVLTGPDAGRGTFRMYLPTRARDVLELTDRSVTYRLGDLPRLRGHTVTFEVEQLGAGTNDERPAD